MSKICRNLLFVKLEHESVNRRNYYRIKTQIKELRDSIRRFNHFSILSFPPNYSYETWKLLENAIHSCNHIIFIWMRNKRLSDELLCYSNDFFFIPVDLSETIFHCLPWNASYHLRCHRGFAWVACFHLAYIIHMCIRMRIPRVEFNKQTEVLSTQNCRKIEYFCEFTSVQRTHSCSLTAAHCSM